MSRCCAMHNSLDDQTIRAMHPDMPEEEHTTAEANCALLEKLLAAIGGQTRRPGNTGSA